MADFFDIGLYDVLGAYVEVESDKSKYSMDAYQQGLAQAQAMLDAEKVSQTTETDDVLDDVRFGNPLSGINPQWLYLGGGALALLIAYKAFK